LWWVCGNAVDQAFVGAAEAFKCISSLSSLSFQVLHFLILQHGSQNTKQIEADQKLCTSLVKQFFCIAKELSTQVQHL